MGSSSVDADVNNAGCDGDAEDDKWQEDGGNADQGERVLWMSREGGSGGMHIRASESCGKRYRYVSKIPAPVLARVFLIK